MIEIIICSVHGRSSGTVSIAYNCVWEDVINYANTHLLFTGISVVSLSLLRVAHNLQHHRFADLGHPKFNGVNANLKCNSAEWKKVAFTIIASTAAR
ncbi:hypothetical protein M513_03963 [Trichuris suis]|uniref:Uncharacterized protein n=1 Tax=Trichuris suis TaxID=68888 RepID=A0A085MCU9_9BILA|nr:hypothetical protein M513_03963 [Trichuris suis]